jgi:hypothetical protein
VGLLITRYLIAVLKSPEDMSSWLGEHRVAYISGERLGTGADGRGDPWNPAPSAISIVVQFEHRTRPGKNISFMRLWSSNSKNQGITRLIITNETIDNPRCPSVDSCLFAGPVSARCWTNKIRRKDIVVRHYLAIIVIWLVNW